MTLVHLRRLLFKHLRLITRGNSTYPREVSLAIYHLFNLISRHSCSETLRDLRYRI